MSDEAPRIPWRTLASAALPAAIVWLVASVVFGAVTVTPAAERKLAAWSFLPWRESVAATLALLVFVCTLALRLWLQTSAEGRAGAVDDRDRGGAVDDRDRGGP